MRVDGRQESVRGGGAGRLILLPDIDQQTVALPFQRLAREVGRGNDPLQVGQRRLEQFLIGQAAQRHPGGIIAGVAAEAGAEFFEVITDGVGVQTARPLVETGSWGAVLWEPLAHLGHIVVVDGIDETGKILIRDPWDATSYKMDREEFINYWNSQAIYSLRR